MNDKQIIIKMRQRLEKQVKAEVEKRNKALTAINTLYGKVERGLLNVLRERIYKYYSADFPSWMIEELDVVCDEFLVTE